MKKKSIIELGIVLVTIFLYVVTIMVINKDKPIYNEDNVKTWYEKAQIKDIIKDNTVIDKNNGIKKGSQTLNVEILSGKYKGKTYTITNYLSALYNVDVKKGDKISVRIDLRNDGEVDVSVYNYYRVFPIIIVMFLFALVLVLIGGRKGFKALIGLVFIISFLSHHVQGKV